MRKVIYLLAIFCIFFVYQAFAQELIIQENEPGFCTIDGGIETSVSGYTGDGYADTDRGIGKSITWSVNATTAGTYFIQWRYANGGGSGDRPVRLLINHEIALDTVNFPHTGEWTNWTISDSVEVGFIKGKNQVRIEAYNPDGTANYDYLIFIGAGISPADCVPSYILTVGQNLAEGGTISYTPVQNYYDEGTAVTLSACSNPGYFFQSWSGDATGTDSLLTFTMSHNVAVTAIFLPDGTTMESSFIGYATVQDDRGTPYLVIGGALGDTVSATTYSELNDYLGGSAPCVVTLDRRIIGTEDLKIGSDKTLLGLYRTAHLQGIEIEINAARNVIIQNIRVSHVTPGDAIVITGKSRNIIIDQCELYSDREHGSEYYDGLLDIKNESSFITVSNCSFHDHYKTSLICSNDESPQDSVIRVTYHHNFFYNCDSRLPSIRFGKAHIFNNYYKDCNTAINSRMGACVRVENNYFENVNQAVLMAYSSEPGSVQLIGNYFGRGAVATEPVCELAIPYPYEHLLDKAVDLPALLPVNPITAISETPKLPAAFSLTHYPNPFNGVLTVQFAIPEATALTISIYDLAGREIAKLASGYYQPGRYQIRWEEAEYSTGIYLVRLATPKFDLVRKAVLLK
ncbi:MAG TPA: T9SS type A sorting domain-containing protein [Candidatus Marinimicrobia bacterium]|nr:T9SS type A sorting domain-containing protein [Candidatus Neomarinimicrobiota bacterium]